MGMSNASDQLVVVLAGGKSLAMVGCLRIGRGIGAVSTASTSSGTEKMMKRAGRSQSIEQLHSYFIGRARRSHDMTQVMLPLVHAVVSIPSTLLFCAASNYC